MTDAEQWVRKVQDEDGMDFTWCDEDHEAELDRQVTTRVWHESPDWTRYEWPDGSAIVSCGDAWDYGVHATRLREAQQLLDRQRDSDYWDSGERAEFVITFDNPVFSTDWMYPVDVTKNTVVTTESLT